MSVKALRSVEFLGLRCIELEGNGLRLLVTQSVGPRVISLQADEGPNLFAELADETLECPGKGDYHLYGGHRLWYAPEVPTRTYLPDDQEIEIQELDDGIAAIQSPEPDTGVRKTIKVSFGQRPNEVVIEHTIKNGDRDSLVCAIWAITQLKPGGIAFLPQFDGHIDGNPFFPNRSLVVWPYTDIKSANLEISNAMITVSSNVVDGALKIGLPNPAGWLAYWNARSVFLKEAPYDPGADYLDYGASSQCYANSSFIELETLGPRVVLNPGEEARHREHWRVFGDVDRPNHRSDIEALIG